MSKVSPYHTSTLEEPPAHRNVHHDHDECPDGKLISIKHKEYGTGGKPLCEECLKLGGRT